MKILLIIGKDQLKIPHFKYEKKSLVVFSIVFVAVYIILGKHLNVRGFTIFLVTLAIVMALLSGVQLANSEMIPGAHGFSPKPPMSRSTPNNNSGRSSGKKPGGSSGGFRPTHSSKKQGSSGGASGFGGGGSGSGDPDDLSITALDFSSGDRSQGPDYSIQKTETKNKKPKKKRK